MYICIYVYMYICIHVHTYIIVYAFNSLQINIQLHTDFYATNHFLHTIYLFIY